MTTLHPHGEYVLKFENNVLYVKLIAQWNLQKSQECILAIRALLDEHATEGFGAIFNTIEFEGAPSDAVEIWKVPTETLVARGLGAFVRVEDSSRLYYQAFIGTYNYIIEDAVLFTIVKTDKEAGDWLDALGYDISPLNHLTT